MHGAIGGTEVEFDERGQRGEVRGNLVVQASAGLAVPAPWPPNLASDGKRVATIAAFVIKADGCGDYGPLTPSGDNYRAKGFLLVAG
jgi:hypothetical protein